MRTCPLVVERTLYQYRGDLAPAATGYDLGQITELSTSVNEVLDSMLMVVPTALPFLLCLMRGL